MVADSAFSLLADLVRRYGFEKPECVLGVGQGVSAFSIVTMGAADGLLEAFGLRIGFLRK